MDLSVFIVLYVIVRQLIGEPIRGKRLVILPAVLAIVGVTAVVNSHGRHPSAVDVVLLVIGVAVSVIIGVRQGLSVRLEARQGSLWGQMPVRSLWLWGALITCRGVLDGLGYAAGAHIATGSAAILMTLGINRLAQAAVVAPRALAAGVPFAPEKDGTSLLSGAFGSRGEGSTSSRPGMSQPRIGDPVASPSNLVGTVNNNPSMPPPDAPDPSADSLSRQTWWLLLRQVADRLAGPGR